METTAVEAERGRRGWKLEDWDRRTRILPRIALAVSLAILIIAAIATNPHGWWWWLVIFAVAGLVLATEGFSRAEHRQAVASGRRIRVSLTVTDLEEQGDNRFVTFDNGWTMTLEPADALPAIGDRMWITLSATAFAGVEPAGQV
jgi:hypothetical protein